MNIFWTHFFVGTLLLFQGVLAQIRILITAEDNSHAKEKKEKRHINLRCRVTDTTDIHIKCQDLWWTREIDQVNHKEVVIGHMKTQSFLTGYQTKLSVHPPKEQSQEVYSCHALCGLQTFTATCHLMDLKNSMIECSSHFMNSYQKLKLRNESTEIHEMKTTLKFLNQKMFFFLLMNKFSLVTDCLYHSCLAPTLTKLFFLSFSHVLSFLFLTVYLSKVILIRHPTHYHFLSFSHVHTFF
ncbi:unnamed protein product [Acanthosepion pharaonis]|uniref:Uncharacterized protein n=1 Tax=Acanthosepion pharaonis TaxID=158019 RepID=A0A812EET8_ACAPH|nr:unnamed protein product [Sepia pharaonis]